jgi:hypothetical protein
VRAAANLEGTAAVVVTVIAVAAMRSAAAKIRRGGKGEWRRCAPFHFRLMRRLTTRPNPKGGLSRPTIRKARIMRIAFSAPR